MHQDCVGVRLSCGSGPRHTHSLPRSTFPRFSFLQSDGLVLDDHGSVRNWQFCCLSFLTASIYRHRPKTRLQALGVTPKPALRGLWLGSDQEPTTSTDMTSSKGTVARNRSRRQLMQQRETPFPGGSSVMPPGRWTLRNALSIPHDLFHQSQVAMPEPEPRWT
jgi:hypothetical protein